MTRGPSRFVCASLALALGLAACRPDPSKGASLTVQAPQADHDADIYVDGHYLGRLGDVGPIQLAPGAHRLEVRKPGRFPVQKTIRVGQNTPSILIVDAELLEDPPG